jgi:hypothetical protein
MTAVDLAWPQADATLLAPLFKQRRRLAAADVAHPYRQSA